MKIGYARVSSDEQNLDLQRDALTAAGCIMIYEDEGVSGVARRRPGLDQAFAMLKQGDILVTWRLDRLGRSLPHLIDLVAALQERSCGFASLNEAIDTSSAGGKLVFHIMGALAEFERALIVERTRAGMASARARGRHLGRPRALTGAQLSKARDEIAADRETTASMAALLGVSRSTLWRALRDRES
ncbi:recombinase family protein [Sphingomonas sp. PAMC 26617]|uniref:recombinase family protein n=1 Tax=Sphingomonas sp. PAMC 26617 TaxID=1112216 RepID=UPI000289B132|nr:recombinase family protein [Sphingomonas sp. PAMC 26617]